MASVPATIDLNWVSQYNGPHRVCVRIQGSGDPYVCTDSITAPIHPNCPGGGLPCSFQINITVDNETCETIVYEGYVQPACEDVESLSGRVPFTVSFIPDPSCKRFLVTCDTAGVASLTLISGGSGYDPMSPPAVTITGGGRTGASATANVGQGVISTLSISNGGSGYTDGNYTGVSITGGSGTGGTADVTITGGIVTNVIINNPGTGYQDSDILGLDPVAMGSSTPTSSVQLSPTTDYGIITSLTLTASGSGYSSAPTVLIDASSSTATASATLNNCSDFDMTACDEIGPETHFGLAVGDSVAICYSTTPPVTLPEGYNITEDGNCLCQCRTVTLSVDTGTADLRFYDCSKQAKIVYTLTPALSPYTVCIVENSLTYNENEGATLTITDNGSCSGA